MIRDNTVVLVDTADPKKTLQLQGLSVSGISSISFSPDSSRMATASYDGTVHTVRLWDVGAGKAIRTLGSAGTGFGRIAFSPDGRMVAATCYDKNLWLWKTLDGQPQKLPFGAPDYQFSVSFSPDSRSVASSGGGALILWDAADSTQRRKVDTQETGVVYSPQGSVLVTYGNQTITVRRPLDGTPIRELSVHKQAVSGVSFSPSGKYMASYAANEPDVVVWDVEKWDVIVRLPHQQNVNWAAFVQQGMRLLSYSDELRAWDMEILENEQKRAAFTMFFDGEKDRYARYIRAFMIGKDIPTQPLAFLGSKAGQVLTGITSRFGLTVEAVDVSIANNSVKSSLPMKIGPSTIRVQPSKLRSLEVVGVEDKAVRMKLTLLDGTQQTATMETGKVTGRGAYADVEFELSDVARMQFDFRFADQKAGTQPAATDSAFRAEVTDAENNKFPVSDVKMPFYDGGRNTGHVLPVYLDANLFKFDFRFLKRIEVVSTPRGGVIVKALLLDDREVIGFVPFDSVPQVSGNIGIGTFNLELAKLKMIEFR